jgi:hypothetical protein
MGEDVAIDPDRLLCLGSRHALQEVGMLKWVMMAGVLAMAGCGVPFVPLI